MTRADQRRFHYIYKITREDGKFYVGMHSTDNLDDGYFGSGQLLWKSIKKHGKEKHSKEILEFLPSRKELKDRERVLVNEDLLGNKLCMNLKLGGEGGWDHVPQSTQLANLAKGAKAGGAASIERNRNAKKSIQTRIKNGNVLTFKGRKHSDETRAKMRAAKQRRKDLSMVQAASTRGLWPACDVTPRHHQLQHERSASCARSQRRLMRLENVRLTTGHLTGRVADF